MENEQAIVRWPSRNRLTSESKLRRSPRHCPICLVALRKNTQRTRQARKCYSCQGQFVQGKQCQKCSGESIWENKSGAACQKCGLHGTKREVIASWVSGRQIWFVCFSFDRIARRTSAWSGLAM